MLPLTSPVYVQILYKDIPRPLFYRKSHAFILRRPLASHVFQTGRMSKYQLCASIFSCLNIPDYPCNANVNSRSFTRSVFPQLIFQSYASVPIWSIVSVYGKLLMEAGNGTSRHPGCDAPHVSFYVTPTMLPSEPWNCARTGLRIELSQRKSVRASPCDYAPLPYTTCRGYPKRQQIMPDNKKALLNLVTASQKQNLKNLCLYVRKGIGLSHSIKESLHQQSVWKSFPNPHALMQTSIEP